MITVSTLMSNEYLESFREPKGRKNIVFWVTIYFITPTKKLLILPFINKIYLFKKRKPSAL